MAEKVKNGQEWPAVYYGLHMVPGVAEYADGPGGQPYRIFISEETAKRMNPSFEGRPVYVEHVDDEIPNIKEKTIEGVTEGKTGQPELKTADGYVIESFYNPADGMNWCKFIVTSREGVEALSRGWKLSNCYQPLSLGPGSEWHGVQYSKEFVDAEYKHLAIVPNPRYRESLVFTSQAFKEYNESKVKEIAALRNSADVLEKSTQHIQTGGTSMSLLDKLFFRKEKEEKVENAEEIGKINVKLGKKRTVSISQLIQNAEKMNDEDFAKMTVEPADRPEHNDDEDKDKDKDMKNRKKDDDVDDKLDDKKKDDDDADITAEELKARKNRKKSDDDDDDDEKKNKKNDDLEDLKDKKNRKKSDDDDDDTKKNKKNDGLEDSPLKHVIMLDGEETTVGDMINAHVDLKNRYNALKNKHNDLKEEHGALRAKYDEMSEGQKLMQSKEDLAKENMEIPERDEDMQTALGKLEQAEDGLETTMNGIRNNIARVITRMKNSEQVKADREQKEKEKLEKGREHFERMQNAERESLIANGEAEVSTETSLSMVERGKSRYGSRN